LSENKDIRIAREYHESTKHTEISIRSSSHTLDFENKPGAFKTYTSLQKIQLPRDFSSPTLNALLSLRSPAIEEETARARNEPSDSDIGSLTPSALAEMLFFSAGITREMEYPSGKYYMRAASATGALYPIEVYIVCSNVPGLQAGVYHFDPLGFSLDKIREGDFKALLLNATAYNDKIADTTATVILTSLAWKNAWKYEARSYRHWFWDSGVIVANMLACAASAQVRSSLVLGFEDEKISKLLSLEDRKEAPIALVPLASYTLEQREASEVGSLDAPHVLPEVRAEYLPLSQSEVEYPIIWKMNHGSALTSQVEVSNWVRNASSIPLNRPSSSSRTSYRLDIDHPAANDPPELGQVILKRGSTRRFSSGSISFKQLSDILHYATGEIKADFLPESDSNLIDVYLISNAVQDLPTGSYFFNRPKETIETLKAGAFRSVSAYLCLEQALFGQASVVFFLMAQLDPILGYLGNRGYGAAQLEAGVMAGKIYLASYSEGIGASGSTFYDDAVTEFFSPHSDGKSTMIAVGVGVPAYKAKPGRVLVRESS